MNKLLLILIAVFIAGCSSSATQKVASVTRALTGGEQPASAFLDPTVKELLEYEMRVCLDGKDKDPELRTECIKTAVAKVKAQKGLDEEPDLDGEVIVRQTSDDEVIDGTKEQKEDQEEQQGKEP